MIFEVGPHRVRHGDLTQGMGELEHPPVEWVYSDPPWGAGNLKYWQTYNHKTTGAPVGPVPATAAKFLDQFFAIIGLRTTPGAVVFVEYGLRWADDLATSAARRGYQVLARARPWYGPRKKPWRLDLWALSRVRRPVPDRFAERVDWTHGYDTLVQATAGWGMEPGQGILDPCCGLGYTARLALARGLTFYGNELCRTRLDKAVALLRKGRP